MPACIFTNVILEPIFFVNLRIKKIHTSRLPVTLFSSEFKIVAVPGDTLTIFSGENRVYEQLNKLQTKVSDNPPQVDLLKEAESILLEWQSIIAQPAISLRREIGDAPGPDQNDGAGDHVPQEGAEGQAPVLQLPEHRRLAPSPGTKGHQKP